MIRLNAKVFVTPGSPGVIKSIRPSALLLGPLISVYGASLYVSRVGPLFRLRTELPSRSIMPSMQLLHR